MSSGGFGGFNGSGANNVKPDIFSDPNGAPLSHGEEAHFRSILAEEDLERGYDEHCENAHRKMWNHFQAAAASLTHLYRERDQLNLRRRRQVSNCDNGGGGLDDADGDSTLWGPFQSAAGNLTHLYREGWEHLLKSGGQIARKSGYQKARRELVSWARSKRRSIRREELLAVLSTMNGGPFQRTSPAPHVQPLLGVEELLQAASVAESSEQPGDAVAAAVVVADPQSAFRSLKRSFSQPVASGALPSGRTSTPSPSSDVNMSEHYGPAFKKPRQA